MNKIQRRKKTADVHIHSKQNLHPHLPFRREMKRLHFRPPIFYTCSLLHSGWHVFAGACPPALVWFISNLTVCYLPWRSFFLWRVLHCSSLKFMFTLLPECCVFVASTVKFWPSCCFSGIAFLKVWVISGWFRLCVDSYLRSAFCLRSANSLSSSSNRIF